MRVLFTIQPGIGHFHAVGSLARALQRDAHEVAFACAPSFCSTVEATGFRSFSAGLDWLESDVDRTFPDIQNLSLEQQTSWFVTNVFGGVAAERMAKDLLSLCASWKPDVVVREEFEFGGCLAAERLGIPHAAVSLGLFFAVGMWKSLIGKRINELRTDLGLPEDPGMEMLYRYLNLSFAPPSYQFFESKAPIVFHSLRPTIFDRSGNERLPDWIKFLPKRPTVHATLGTVFANVKSVYLTIVEALVEEPVNLVITTGRNPLPKGFWPKASNLYVERYIPHTLLLPHCDLVISHGGAATTMCVLSHGLPMILIPLSADQPFHAMRCSALGVACVIKQPDQFGSYLFDRFYGELSARSIRSAVKEILDNPKYKLSAERLRNELLSLPGMERATELLCKLAVEKKPQFT